MLAPPKTGIGRGLIMAGDNGISGFHVVAAGSSEHGEIAFHGYGGRRPRVLAHGGNGAKHLAQDDRFLYWTNEEEGTVTRLPKGGGVPLELATGQERPRSLVLSGDHLYWVSRLHAGRGAVLRMPAEGGDVEQLACGQELPEALAVHGDTVVWTNFGDGLATGTVMRKQIGGGPATVVASKQKQPCSIAIDAEQIYWTNLGNKRPTYFRDGSVVRAPRAGGTKRFVIAKDRSMPTSITIDDGWIYWNLAAAFGDDPRIGGIVRRRKSGGATIPIVLWRFDSGVIALDATHAYWMQDFGGALFRVAKQGGDPEQIMAGNGERMLRAEGLLVDDRCVYWTARFSKEAGGAVFSMGK